MHQMRSSPPPLPTLISSRPPLIKAHEPAVRTWYTLIRNQNLSLSNCQPIHILKLVSHPQIPVKGANIARIPLCPFGGGPSPLGGGRGRSPPCPPWTAPSTRRMNTPQRSPKQKARLGHRDKVVNSPFGLNWELLKL